MRFLRSRSLAALTSKGLLAGLLSALVFAPAVAVALPSGEKPSVPSRELADPVSVPAETGTAKAPKVVWPKAATKTVDLGAASAARRTWRSVAGEASAVSVRAAKASGPAVKRSPGKVAVEVLDRKRTEAAGAVGLAVRVARQDGGRTAAPVEVALDYSGFAQAYGGDFAGRLRLMKLPACAATTPQLERCRQGRYVKAVNDTEDQTLTATVEAAPQTKQISGMSALSEPAVLAVTSGSSSDNGDYRASTLSPTGKWDVSLGSGAFTYSVPIEVPKPPVGEAPDLALTYNSQSIDGRTSASNNQASWVGMGWDLNVGYIERRYKNCTQDGHPTFGDLCWDSPNSSADPNGAAYVISLNGVASELIQDNTGTGSFHLKDDPGWKVQKLNGGYGSDNTDEFWVVTQQDGTRHYFGWGRTERLNSSGEREKTNSVLTVPVIGDDTGEPCNAQFPEPCKQAWRWNLDRVVTPNEVENVYFYKKEQNHYRSVAAADKARSYDAGSYLERIDYGWSSQIPGAQLPAQVDFQHVNRCVERMTEKDPLDNVAPDCPTIDAEPESYPDVPVDLICDGPDDGESCAGKTYYPTFFLRDMLWDINIKVRDNNDASWDLVRQYQMKYSLMNPSGSVGDQLWLDYIQRRGYAGDDITLPTINFNGEWQDNKVGAGELNFRRVNKVFTDTGSTITATYGHATDDNGTISRQCDENNLPSQSDNKYECFWQKWTPEGTETAQTGWFKKFVVTQVVVDPGDLADGNPSMTTTYEYDGTPGWRFGADPLAKDEDETWSEWRGYGKVLVTTGAGTNRHSTYHWLYRGLDGDRTSKTDASQTRSVDVTDSAGTAWKDSAWLAGKTLETSARDHEDESQKREWHEYWTYNTAQYTGLPDARFVRESEVRTLEKVHTSTDSDTSTWRERVTQWEFENDQAASTTFGLPMRIDEWGQTGVSDNHCTEFGRTYNTDTLDGTGTIRWMVYQDDERHYTVSCTTQAEDQAAGQDTLHQDKRTVTFYDGATSFSENDTKLTDGNATEIRMHTSASAYRSARSDYDEAGRRTKAWDGRNNLTTTTYSPATSWPVDGVTTTTPDPDGTGSRTAMTSAEYLSRHFGKPWKTVDANGNTTRIVYDAVGRLSQVFKPTEAANYPDGNPSMKFTYSIPVATSETGVPDVATGAALKTTTQTLQSGSTYALSVGYSDGLGRIRETQEPAPSGTGRIVTSTRYDSSGNVAGTSAPFYNSSAAGSGVVNPAVADIPSYTDAQVDWAGRTTLTQIQAKGVDQAVNRTVTRYIGADLVTVFPPEGGAVDTYTDVYGQTVKTVEHIGATSPTTRYEYTRSGKLKYVHDSQDNTTHYTYNWAGDRVTTDDPDAGGSSTSYDANGKVETTTDANGTVLTYEYDPLNRPTKTKQGTTLLAERTYDTATGGKNLPAASISYVAGKAYTAKVDAYDARGRETSKTLTVPDDGSGLNGSYTFGYGYDAADHMTAVAYPAIGGLPAETVTSTYTGQGRLSKVSSGLKTYLATTGYDDYGRLTSRTLGTAGSGAAVTRTLGYDDANGTGWLKNITTSTVVDSVTKEVQDDNFTRDKSGSVTALRETLANQQQCYRYDDLNRLTDAWTTTSTTCAATPQSDFSGPDPYQTKYTYDRLGNIQSVTDTTASGAATRDYKYAGYSADESTYTPDQDRPHAVASVTTGSGTDSYGYDSAGQLTSRTVDGVSSNLVWTPGRQLASITEAGKTSTYVRDADGNVIARTSATEKVLYLDGHELHKAGTAAAQATRYYAAEGASLAMRTADGSAEGQLTWLLGDGQASVQLAVTAVAGVVTRRRYTPFGDERDSTVPLSGSDRGFLGKAEDPSTGLSLLGARVYDPELGRFLSTDPLTSPYQPQKLSSYSYSENDPVNYSDPTGLDDGRACRCGSRPPLKPGGGGGTTGGSSGDRGTPTTSGHGCDQACLNALNSLVSTWKKMNINKRLAIELQSYVKVLGGNIRPCIAGVEASSGVAAGCMDLDGYTSDVTWQDVLEEWTTGRGNILTFGIGSKVTQQLATGPHNTRLLTEIQKRIADADYDISPSELGGNAAYVDGEGMGKLAEFPKDVLGMLTDGRVGKGTPDAFLGSFNEVYQVLNVDKKNRQFTVGFAAFNNTGTASLTHFLPDIGQGNQYASVHQTYYWTLTVRE
ncbi:RHS repeat-associated core domain-containing protein [Streptomyces sp. cf386]|uniref:RHS repeat-associated core domain-containing protein n=1 Tax=Streptomyces sp. cf386 TaxID=1761904 RepID=UPI000888D098|nr:RHS repeat-associated core domain-containing protein [Streptomyces sp. cf386]SDO86648.1 RHS repeat-associated core domain-containing protein [Streptomyces sp. cf386]